MHSFVVKEITEIEGPYRFFRVLRNGRDLLESFFKEIQKGGNLEEEWDEMVEWMEHYAHGTHPPKTKFKELKRGKKDKIKDYEFKSKNLRLYFVYDPDYGGMILLGGKKKDQKGSIERMRKIKKEYFTSKDQGYVQKEE